MIEKSDLSVNSVDNKIVLEDSKDLILVGSSLDRVVQPIAVATMQYDYSLVGQKILAAVTQRLQTSVHELLSKEKEEPQQTSLFVVEDNNFVGGNDYVRLPIRMYDFGVQRKHYKLLIDTLEKMGSIPVRRKVKDKDGNDYIKLSSLFTAFVPNTKKTDIVYIDIEKETAAYLIDIRGGYFNYLTSTIFNAKSRYTPRIYIFISSWKDKGITRKKMSEFRKMLFLTKELNGKRDMYKRFTELQRCVIKPAYDELKQKAMDGETDCYFEWTPIFKNGKKNGEPDLIQFTIIKSDLGDQISKEKDFIQKKLSAKTVLIENFNISKSNVEEIMSKVTEENISKFYLTIEKIDKLVQTKKPSSIPAFSYTCFINSFKKQEEQPSKETKSPKNANNNTPLPCEIRTQMSEQDNKKWNLVLKFINEKINNRDYTTWFLPIVPIKYANNTLIIRVPSRFFMQWLEEHYVDLLREALETAFGQGTLLQYNIASN